MPTWTKQELAAFRARTPFATEKQHLVAPKVAVLGQSTDEAKLNKTERLFLQHLRNQKYDWIGIQNLTVKLAFDCRYTVDFVTCDKGQLTGWEVKGREREDAIIKLKVAARMFPFIKFTMVKSFRGKGWQFEEIKP